MTKDETQPDDQLPEDRPMPGDGTRDTGSGGASEISDSDSDSDESTSADGAGPPPGPDVEPVYNDRDKLDFDPDEGLYTGTAVTGDTAIPGEHERVDDVPEEDADDSA